jgi:hypothetical protein
MLFPYDRWPQDHQKHQNNHDKDNPQNPAPGFSGFPKFLNFLIRYSFLGDEFKLHQANLCRKCVYRFFVLSFPIPIASAFLEPTMTTNFLPLVTAVFLQIQT